MTKKARLSISSPTFNHNDPIPQKYTCEGENISPPLIISGAPDMAKSLLLIMDDPDVPKQLHPEGLFTHWLVFNISPSIQEIPEGVNPRKIGIPGANGKGGKTYFGPCPPPQYMPNEHRYIFSLFALDTVLPFPAGATKLEIQAGMDGHIMQEAQFIGTYKRTQI